MATLTLTVAANDDDWLTDDAVNASDNNGNLRVGGVGTTPQAGHGVGFRFTGAGALVGATINSSIISLYKETSQWQNQADRWAFEDSDSPVAFDGTNNQPGDRAIVTTNIADEVHNVNHLDNTRYDLPTTTALRQTLGANLQSVVNRVGFAGTLALIDNSDQDTNAYTNFSRKLWAAFEHADANSEPQLVVDYTAAVQPFPPVPGRVHRDRTWTGYRM